MNSRTILTNRNVEMAMSLDSQGMSYEEQEKYKEELVEEQDKKLEELGYRNDCCQRYVIHSFDSAFSNEYTSIQTIYEAIECLALKEGADLVRFANGNIGFVGYYGIYEDGFEILREATEEDMEEE